CPEGGCAAGCRAPSPWASPRPARAGKRGGRAAYKPAPEAEAVRQVQSDECGADERGFGKAGSPPRLTGHAGEQKRRVRGGDRAAEQPSDTPRRDRRGGDGEDQRRRCELRRRGDLSVLGQGGSAP